MDAEFELLKKALALYYETLARRHNWHIKNIRVVDAMVRNFVHGRRMYLNSCPCQLDQHANICPCIRFLKTGTCICGLFENINRKKKT